MLYGIYSELSKGTPLTPQDEFCVTGTGKTEDIQRTTTSERQFFDEPYFNSTSAENLEKLALNMQAESIEEAFELYYASILTPSDCERPDIQVGDYLLQACDIGAMNTETAHDVYQETYNVTDVSTVCPLGYHVPT
ncbi:MAG: hypothetical protein LBG59_08285 [Candidatus Peribacteria bacterium]|jgi:hypothetical protein|nr:hypothetical protein [Candidatus Peribacteria bacterium]